MGYLIAAYVVVLAGFAGYALWLRRRRAEVLGRRGAP